MATLRRGLRTRGRGSLGSHEGFPQIFQHRTLKDRFWRGPRRQSISRRIWLGCTGTDNERLDSLLTSIAFRIVMDMCGWRRLADADWREARGHDLIPNFYIINERRIIIGQIPSTANPVAAI